MDLLLEQARHFPGEADACYVLEWDGQRRVNPTEDEVCACLRALVQGTVEYLTLTAPAPRAGWISSRPPAPDSGKPRWSFKPDCVPPAPAACAAAQ